MTPTRSVAGILREVWVEAADQAIGWVDVPTNIEMTTAKLGNVRVLIVVGATQGTPTVAGACSIVNRKLVVRVTVGGDPGSTASWVLDVQRMHSVSQANNGTATVLVIRSGESQSPSIAALNLLVAQYMNTPVMTTTGDMYAYDETVAALVIIHRPVDGAYLVADAATSGGWIAQTPPPGYVGYDMVINVQDKPIGGEEMARIVMVRNVTLPVDLSGSMVKSGDAATAATVLTLKKNGASVGTSTWAPAGTVATLAAASPISLVAGDQLTVTNQAIPDATLAKIAITLKGER